MRLCNTAGAPTTNCNVKAIVWGVGANLCPAPLLWSVLICMSIIYIIPMKCLLTRL